MDKILNNPRKRYIPVKERRAQEKLDEQARLEELERNPQEVVEEEDISGDAINNKMLGKRDKPELNNGFEHQNYDQQMRQLEKHHDDISR